MSLFRKAKPDYDAFLTKYQKEREERLNGSNIRGQMMFLLQKEYEVKDPKRLMKPWKNAELENVTRFDVHLIANFDFTHYNRKRLAKIGCDADFLAHLFYPSEKLNSVNEEELERIKQIIEGYKEAKKELHAAYDPILERAKNTLNVVHSVTDRL